MLKKFLSVAIVGAFALSGCSQTKAEVKAPAEINTTKAVDANATAVVEKAAPKVRGGAMHVPFSEMMK
ncbi:hypothetical protein KKC13_07995 [bacterium]|nr:hypothetical protein [bacterium]MBU1956836.1 hypothetical protein [bacterium]